MSTAYVNNQLSIKKRVQDQNMETGNVAELCFDKDEMQIFHELIDTIKAQFNKLKTNKLILSDLNKKKVVLQQTQWEEFDKHLELQRSISEVRIKNGIVQDQIMYLDQFIHLKKKVVDEHDLKLLQTTDKISNAFKNYLNAVNVKLKFIQKCVLNAKIVNFEVIVNTAEVCLAYDLVLDRYELISLYPTHPKFDEIRTFLNQSGDVSGFLASVYLWMTAKIEKNELNS